MKLLAWTLVVVGAVLIAHAVFDRTAATEIAAARQLATRALDDVAPDPTIEEAYPQRTPAAAHPRPVRGGAGATTRAGGTGPEPAAPIEAQLHWTESALGASQRSFEPAVARHASASPASREAVAAAASGAAAVALGCEGAGLACQSSADCCPGLACAGGVAGYGTVGRCEVPR
jgi:hypothetical protein